ncbi:MAG: segregation and condensation protein A [Gammaproteobacteria bacterium]|nr:segregation and condensation protein A [Gammaproteobacteria bacterium]
MSTNFHSKEHQILVTLRRVLSAVVRDTTPSPGRPGPLSAKTIDDVKHCFQLITSREKEIIEQAGGNEMDSRPQYADEPKTSQVVQFNKPKNKD